VTDQQRFELHFKAEEPKDQKRQINKTKVAYVAFCSFQTVVNFRSDVSSRAANPSTVHPISMYKP
jgi:hypothetical protein